MRRTPSANRWAGIFLVALGVLGLAVAQFLATGPDTVDVSALVWIAGATIALGAAAVVLPWRHWPHAAGLVLAVAALGLLVLVDQLSGYSRTEQAAATYPLYVALILAWVGLTQPRRTALAFTLCVGAALALVVIIAEESALPLSALVVVLPAGAALGEAGAWIMSELRALSRREEERTGRLVELARMLDQLPQRATLEDAGELVARMARQIFATPAVHVLLLDRDGTMVDLGSGDRTLLTGLDNRTATAVAAARNSYASSDLLGTPLVSESSMSVVLCGASRPLGAVSVHLPQASAEPYVLDLARLFASQVGRSLEQFELIRFLDHAVQHDELTGTGNRRHASVLLASMRPSDALIMVDVDHFKDINDTQGHRAGDALLQSLGQYLNSYVRGSDDVARFGGDEFVVVARGIGHDATSAADRLLQGWRALRPQATVSIGVALHRMGDDPETTLERADGALYAAKRSGRNQVAVAPDHAPA